MQRATHRQLATQNQTLDWLSRRLLSPAAAISLKRQQLQHCLQSLRYSSGIPLQRSRHTLAQLDTQLKNQRPDVRSARTLLHDIQHRIQQCQRHALSQQRQQLNALQTQLELLNPQRTLDRGYAIIRDNKGKLLRSPQDLHPQSLVNIRLANGSADVGISSVQPSLDP